MYGPYLSSIGGGHPLRSPRCHSLGKPLPYQLADTEQAHPKAINLYSEETIKYYPIFRLVIPDFGVGTYLLLPRLPLFLRTVWLACLIHAASVHPELGSNSNHKWTEQNRKYYFILFSTGINCFVLCVVDLHVCECFYHLLRSMHYRIKFSNNCIKSTLSKGVETILLGLRIKSSGIASLEVFGNKRLILGTKITFYWLHFLVRYTY